MPFPLDTLAMLVQAAQQTPPQPGMGAPPSLPPPGPESGAWNAGPTLPSINPGPGQVLPPTSPMGDAGERLQRGIAQAQELGTSSFSDAEKRQRDLGDQAAQLTARLGSLPVPTVGMHVGRDQSLGKNLLNILATIGRATAPVRAIRQGDYEMRAAPLIKQLDEIRKQQQSEAARETAAGGLVTKPLYAQQRSLGAETRAGAQKSVAQIQADAKTHVAQIMAGQVSKLVPGVNPETGEPGYQKLDRTGQSMGWVDHSTVVAMMGQAGTGVELKEDASGNIVAVTKPTTSQRVLPGTAGAVPAGGRSGQGGRGGPQPALPAAPGAPAPRPALPAPAQPAPRQRTAAGPRVVMKGPKAVESVFAFNPQTNETELTDRGTAVSRGFTGIRNATQPEIENARQLNVRLGDVQQKIQRYVDSFNKDLSYGDTYALNKLVSDQSFKAAMAFKPEVLGTGIGGVDATLPVDFLTNLDKAAQANGLSDEARERLYAFMNAREAMVGYQRVLSGSGRGNEKQMELLLQTLPTPNLWRGTAANAFDQFRQNLSIAAQGIPRMQGVAAPGDFQKGQQNATPNEPTATGPNGHKIAFRNGQWVDATTGRPIQ